MGVDGKVVEHGTAVENVFNDNYVFKATERNVFVRGSKLLITVRDRPGNMVVREVFF